MYSAVTRRIYAARARGNAAPRYAGDIASRGALTLRALFTRRGNMTRACAPLYSPANGNGVWQTQHATLPRGVLALLYDVFIANALLARRLHSKRATTARAFAYLSMRDITTPYALYMPSVNANIYALPRTGAYGVTLTQRLPNSG